MLRFPPIVYPNPYNWMTEVWYGIVEEINLALDESKHKDYDD